MKMASTTVKNKAAAALDSHLDTSAVFIRTGGDRIPKGKGGSYGQQDEKQVVDHSGRGAAGALAHG